MKVKLVQGTDVGVGVGTRAVLTLEASPGEDHGWVMDQEGIAYSWNRVMWVCTRSDFGQVPEGSVVTVRVLNNGNVTYVVDGTDKGVVFSKVLTDQPLYLAVWFCDSGGQVCLI
jgi:hypothetical protein